MNNTPYVKSSSSISSQTSIQSAKARIKKLALVVSAASRLSHNSRQQRRNEDNEVTYLNNEHTYKNRNHTSTNRNKSSSSYATNTGSPTSPVLNFSPISSNNSPLYFVKQSTFSSTPHSSQDRLSVASPLSDNKKFLSSLNGRASSPQHQIDKMSPVVRSFKRNRAIISPCPFEMNHRATPSPPSTSKSCTPPLRSGKTQSPLFLAMKDENKENLKDSNRTLTNSPAKVKSEAVSATSPLSEIKEVENTLVPLENTVFMPIANDEATNQDWVIMKNLFVLSFLRSKKKKSNYRIFGAKKIKKKIVERKLDEFY